MKTAIIILLAAVLAALTANAVIFTIKFIDKKTDEAYKSAQEDTAVYYKRITQNEAKKALAQDSTKRVLQNCSMKRKVQLCQ